MTTDDFTDGQLQGTVTVQNNTAIITRAARADLVTEGSELFRLEIRETSYTSPVMITSTSSIGGNFVGIGDTSTTPVITYVSLVGATDESAGSTTLFEGQFTATFTLTTTGAPNGTVVYWTTLSNFGTINASDFSDNQVQGTVTIQNNTATITRTARADAFTEGSEVFRLEIRETSYTSTVKVTSGPIGVADTSTTPPGTPTYAVAAQGGATSVNEGSSLTFTVTTTNVTDTTVLYWSLSNTSDFTTSNGTVTINSNTGTFSVIPRADATTELAAETFTASISTTNGGNPVATSGSITINDTSQTPSLPIITYVSFVGVTNLAPGSTTLFEGQYTATFTLTTTGGVGQTVYWTTLGSVTYPLITAADFTDNTLQGTATIGSDGIATITRSARADLFTEGIEIFSLEIREGGYDSPVKITSSPFGIADTSTTITATITPTTLSVDEGAPLLCTVTTVGTTDNTTLYWSVSRPGDFTVSSNSFTIVSNTGSFTVTPTADNTTEALTETFTVSVLSEPTGGSFTPTILATSDPITINDTSKTRTYSIIPVAVTVNEGTAVRFNITTANVPNNTQLFWTVTNAGDFSTSAGSVFIQGDAANFSVTPTLDFVTEGTETFTASISLTNGGAPVATSNSVTINDILGLPVYTITPSSSSVSEGSQLTVTVTTTNVPPNTTLYWTVTNPVPVVAPPTPVYTITPAASSVNEGASLRINVSGSNIPNGTHYWTIGTNLGDFGVTSGSFTITSNAGFFDVSPTADVTTENTPETFTVTVRTDSITGTPVVTTLIPITINDTSQAPPVPTYSVSASASSVNEGSPLTFTVTTTNVANTTVLNWAVSNASDFVTSNGTVTITTTGINGTGTFAVTPRADATTEAVAETFTASVYTGSISGLPVATSSQITINDTSQTPVAATYAIATSPGGITSVNEGVEITFIVTTTNIVNGTTLNWAVSNAGDFATSSGTVTITGNSGTFRVTPRADATTETVPESFTASVYTGSISGTPVVSSNAITINDTSQTPPPPTYAVAALGGATSVNEGSPITFTVTTTNLSSPTTVYWTILDNVGDFTTPNGEVIINNNTGNFTVTPTADATTEATAETFRVGIRTNALSIIDVVVSNAITINDTSQTPPAAPIYAVAPANGATSVDEGTELTFNVTTTGVASGTTLYWAYKDGSAIAADLTTANGSFNINSQGQGTFIVRPVADDSTEGPQTFRVGVRTASVTGPEQAFSISVIINDTSLTPVPPESAVYAVTPATSFVNEGSPITFTVTTINVLNGTPLFWSVNNTGEFGNSSGTVIISATGINGTGTFTVTPIADATTEGPETFRATIRSISSSGAIEVISDLVTINDTSQAPPPPNPPTYSVIPAAGAVSEGVELLFTVNTTNVSNNTILSWAVSPASVGDFGVSTGFVTINSNTGTFSVTPALDVITEGPESFSVNIFTGSITGEPVATSTSVSIVDTSQGPPTPALPEYYVTPSALAVNEGVPLIITVDTVNVDNNTRLYWTISTNAGDFLTSSGSVLIVGNTGSFSVTPTQDGIVELAETFTVTIRTDSITGTPVVTSNLITINAGVPLSLLFTTKITPTVYNNARTQVVGVLGATTTGQPGATQGYGQPLASSAVSQHEKITESQLDNLRSDIVKTRIHQSDADPNLINVAAGGLALADSFDAYAVLATTCNTLKDQIGPNQLANTTYTQTATYSAYTGTPNTGGGWKNYAFYEVTVTFATADNARYFFNAGSSFKFSASRTGGTIAPTVGLNQNTSWTNLLLAVTADNPTFAKNNFYALSNTYSTVYNKNSTGVYSANYYRIQAKSNIADNSYGGATVVTFKIEFVDAFNDGNNSNYDGVDGIFESVVVRSMPKGMGLGGAISVAAPTSVIPAPSNGFTVDGTPIYITATYQIAASPASVSEANATINFTFTASNYNVPNTVTWFITATSPTGLSDFVETGWTSATTIDGFKQLSRTTNLSPTSTFAASFTTTSIVTNPDSLTEGTETFTVVAVPAADGSGGGIASDPVTITVTDSSKTPTPGYALSIPAATPNLSCIPGEGLGASGLFAFASISLTGSTPLVIYGIYLDISANNNINSYNMTLWDGTVLTETTTTFYTLPTPKSIANGGNVQFNIRVGSTSGTAGTGSVTLRFRTNAGSVDGSGPNIVGPSYNSASQTVSVQIVQPTIVLTVTASPPSVSYNYVSGNTGSASTEITVTNTGNARATLSNYNVSNPGGGSVSAGLISGLILAGGTKTTTVTYSTTSAYSGTSNISIVGENALIGTTSASRNVSVTATQAFGIISPRFSLASFFSGPVFSTNTFFITIDNVGLAPLTVTNITFSGTTNMTITPVLVAFPQTIGPSGTYQATYQWNRSRIGTSSVMATITSNTGGVAGTPTSLSREFIGTATTPTFTLTGSGPGAVVGRSWTSNDGVLPKEGSIRIAFAGLEPNALSWAVMLFWTTDQDSYGAGGKGVAANTNITDPKAVPIGSFPPPSPFAISSTGEGVAWSGTDPIETRYWRAGRNRFYVQLPVGKRDDGTQVWYTNARSGTSAASWATSTTFPEAACGDNQTWIGFTVIPNVTWSFDAYEPVQGDTVTYELKGAASNVTVNFAPVSWSIDSGTSTTGYTPLPPGATTDAGGIASGSFSTLTLAVGTYNNVRAISPSGAGDTVFFQGPFRTFDILSPALYIIDGVLPVEWGTGSAASNSPDIATAPSGTYIYYRRVPAGNGTYTGLNIRAAVDDLLEVYCQGVLLLSGSLPENPFIAENKTVTVSDGFSHWRFRYTNGPGLGYFGVAVYVGTNLYFALSNPGYIKDASKW
jgi:hypothetical protein